MTQCRWLHGVTSSQHVGSRRHGPCYRSGQGNAHCSSTIYYIGHRPRTVPDAVHHRGVHIPAAALRKQPQRLRRSRRDVCTTTCHHSSPSGSQTLWKREWPSRRIVISTWRSSSAEGLCANLSSLSRPSTVISHPRCSWRRMLVRALLSASLPAPVRNHPSGVVSGCLSSGICRIVGRGGACGSCAPLSTGGSPWAEELPRSRSHSLAEPCSLVASALSLSWRAVLSADAEDTEAGGASASA